MRKRKRGSTGAKARRYEPATQPARSDSPRRRHGASSLVPSRRPLDRIRSRTERRRRTIVSRTLRDDVPGQRQFRRDDLQPRRRSRSGLPATTLSLRRPNENASREKTSGKLCTRKKEVRRAVIMATGYGGINNARNYRKHEQCR